jgi:hypothetical protein
MTDKKSFWDIDFRSFEKSKETLDAQISELITEFQKDPPQYADDVIDRVEVLQSIQGALDTLGTKLRALQRYGIESLSDEDKMVVVSALESAKNLLALMKKLGREEIPHGQLARHVYGQRKEPYDWNQ